MFLGGSAHVGFISLIPITMLLVLGSTSLTLVGLYNTMSVITSAEFLSWVRLLSFFFGMSIYRTDTCIQALTYSFITRNVDGFRSGIFPVNISRAGLDSISHGSLAVRWPFVIL